jgi:hypothetical protein
MRGVLGSTLPESVGLGTSDPRAADEEDGVASISDMFVNISPLVKGFSAGLVAFSEVDCLVSVCDESWCKPWSSTY